MWVSTGIANYRMCCSASKALQVESLDSQDLLGNALTEEMDLRNCFKMGVKEATKICAEWGITNDEFSDKRIRKVKKKTLWQTL